MRGPWKIHKFGGTSVLNAERIRIVSDIILQQLPQGPKAIVVSAMKGVTDDLLQSVELAQKGADFGPLLDKIESRHHIEIEALIPQSSDDLKKIVSRDIRELHEILRGVLLVKTASKQIFDLVSGMGEVWSAQILASYIQSRGHACKWLDARAVLIVQSAFNQVSVQWSLSQEKLQQSKIQQATDLIVITGFVASTTDGIATTLGRNGSDYSASIFACLLGCDEVYIWTDVDGVLSADPRLVPEAVLLQEISYNEVSELAYFGAKVVHPATMAPVIEKEIPIWIRNTFNPTAAGTKIHKGAKSERSVKGFSSIDKMALVNVEGTGMVGIPGMAERLFAALRSANVNVVLISQASSEHSICFAVTEEQSQSAKMALQEAFRYEIECKQIQSIQAQNGISILAAVGDNMARSPGVSGKFFASLGQAGVNVRAIAQGSSERNISAVIDSCDAQKALRAVHSGFVLQRLPIAIGLIGPGLIGKTFLKQLSQQAQEIRDRHRVDIQLRAIANSKQMLLSDSAISFHIWEDDFAKKSVDFNLDQFIRHIRPSHLPHAAVIETSASEALPKHYSSWLDSGLHIISPNKKAMSGDLSVCLGIEAAARRAQRHFLYSTNVGAGLPILQTLRDLCSTGDIILDIKGILSGTLSFIFNQYDESKSFSEIVLEAMAKGLTEPDPREDLSGMDVARKIVILAREIGLSLSLKDVEVVGLVPQEMLHLSRTEFLSKLRPGSELDNKMLTALKAAQSRSEILRYVGSIDAKGRAKVKLEALPVGHAFQHVSGTDNIVLFRTQRYDRQPLVIQGPGAGPEVTAAGVFADMLRLARYLGAHL